MSGSMINLAKWFMEQREINDPHGAAEVEREEIISDLFKPLAVNCRTNSMEQKETWVRTEKGIAVLTVEKGVRNVEIVTIDYVYKTQIRRVGFWMNKSSLTSLGNILRQAPRKSCDDIFADIN